MLKYVVFELTGMYVPVLIPECVAHSQVKIEGGTPISAGFYDVIRKYTYGTSESLKLKPHKRDELLILHLLANSGTMFFLKENYK